jgi:hypothetical protein
MITTLATEIHCRAVESLDSDSFREKLARSVHSQK